MLHKFASVKSELDTEGPIDFDQLRAAVQTIGPLRMHQPGNPYSIFLSIEPCRCGQPECTEELVLVERRKDLFSIRWQLSPAELLEFGSLDRFRLSVLAGCLDDTLRERQTIEHNVETHLGMSVSEVSSNTICLCTGCMEAMGERETARHMLLSQLAFQLNSRTELLEEVGDQYGSEVADLVKYAFDIGYQSGRIFSEYVVDQEIEPYAREGVSFEELKSERAKRGGERSSEKRAERIASLLTHMEKLASDNPALVRLPSHLAKLACEDAKSSNPALWSQGAGQVDEYLGLIRRGEAGDEMRARFVAMLSPRLVAKTA